MSADFKNGDVVTVRGTFDWQDDDGDFVIRFGDYDTSRLPESEAWRIIKAPWTPKPGDKVKVAGLMRTVIAVHRDHAWVTDGSENSSLRRLSDLSPADV